MEICIYSPGLRRAWVGLKQFYLEEVCSTASQEKGVNAKGKDCIWQICLGM